MPSCLHSDWDEATGRCRVCGRDEPCRIAGCSRPRFGSRDLCYAHVRRERAHGDPTAGASKRHNEPLEVRFWKRVATAGPDECWEWTGSRHKRGGYGQVTATINGVRRPWKAHRIAWELANTAEVPEGLEVCHTCDNPPCCNPTHLFVGSHADNMADMKSKGRGRGWRSS